MEETTLYLRLKDFEQKLQLKGFCAASAKMSTWAANQGGRLD
jgi:hypothetical protein